MRKKPRSPDEKKRLSYERDRRNTYGENSKSSRKNIPLQRALVRRANRKAAAQALETLRGSVDEAAAEHAENQIAGRRPKSWRKQPDEPLGVVLKRKRAGRSRTDKTIK